ncbi:M20 aminoacylase family protein [Vannielia sp.]|uniref:M20 aminoacylase family protein n=1 Tax=Vannielia sp. TaxID=2813045 RepID=UPI002621FFA5|nr:M20 aminoacylase family protein [Vannielia sp.]MDF1873759.1 M20 family metallopeptidase [Vannielia sp.]
MPIVNRIAAQTEEMAAWRQHLHAHPELEFDCHETAAFVAERLREFGVDEVHEGIARTGLVAVIRGQGKSKRRLGLRADMDALPIEEATGAAYASKVAGRMHACGHDGHTTMLLGAAKYLAETRNFAGEVALIFQPAEEHGGGGKVMVDEGIMDRFGITEVYGIHNAPGMAEGEFLTTPGAILAAVDSFDINIKGQGGHAALPHLTRDPIVAAVGMVSAINTIASRNHYALDELVVSVTQIHAGSADNVIPDTAYINGTVRSFDGEVRTMARRRLAEIVAGQAEAFGVAAELIYHEEYPATINTPREAAFAADVAQQITGRVERDGVPGMGAEDFSYMLEARPGAFLFLGAGEDRASLHHPKYDFNDEVAPIGASFFARLVETAQPVTD